MEPSNVSAVISASAGIAGVLLGNSFVTVKEVLVGKSRRDKDRSYLAIIVVSHLDRFVSRCVDVAFDDGTWRGQPAGEGGRGAVTVSSPAFQPLDLDVEWRVLPQDLMYAVLRLPAHAERIENKLRYLLDFDDNDDAEVEYFWTRRLEYAKLGLQASAVARALREHAEMPLEEPMEGEPDRREMLAGVVDKVNHERDLDRIRAGEHYAANPPPPPSPPTL